MRSQSLTVEELPLARLRPYERNARTHSPAQVEQIAASVREFGWTNPLLIDEAGLIIAGHGRLEAAKVLGLAAVPCIRLEGLSDQQKRALSIADNKLGLNAGWDEALLAAELQSLGDLQGLVGFSEDELVRLFKGHAGLTDPDEAPEAPAEPVSQRGDVWLLGAHRLVCGDATSAEDVALALNGVKPNLMVTDPPYGVEYDAAWRQEAGLASAVARGKVENDDRADWREAWHLFPGSVAYVWHSGLKAGVVTESLEARGLKLRAQIIWVKQRPAISRGAYHWQHEPLAYAVAEGADDGWRFVPEHEVLSYAVAEGDPAGWHGGRRQSTVWNIEHIKSDTGHSTQKPVECMRRPIENNSSAGQAVYEPFSGSGTTIIAAEMMSRACYALEISPAYVDVAVVRWQNFTGKRATAPDGRHFPDVASARASAPRAA